MLAARELGRPVRWIETRSENMVGMTHGRAQIQTVTIGGRRDGTVLAYRLDVLQDSGAYPHIGAVPAAADRPDGARGLRHSARSRRLAQRRHQHDAGRRLPRRGPARGDGRGRTGDGPVRRRDRARPGRGPPPQPAAPLHRAARRPSAARSTTPATTRRRSTSCCAAPTTTGCAREQAQRRERGDVVQLGIGVSVYVEITGAGGEAGAPNENATVEVHPDGIGDHPHRHVAARPGPPDGLGDARQRGARHPDRQDHGQVGRHRPGSRRRRHRRLAQPAAGRRGRPAGRRGADRARQGPGGRRARGRPGRPASSTRPSPACRSPACREPRSPSPSWPRASGCSSARSSPRPAPPSRSAPTSPSSRSTPRPGKATLRAHHRRRRRRHDHQPAAGRGPAARRPRPGRRPGAARRGRLRRRRQPATRPRSPTTRSCRPPSCPASSWSTWRRRRRYNPLGAKGIGEAGTIGSTPAVQNAVIDARRPPRCPPHRHAHLARTGLAGDQRGP